MNGDLSLSRALGGLRIANPDDASSSPAREASTEPDDRHEGPGIQTQYGDESQQTASDAYAQSVANGVIQPATEASRPSPHTYESAAAILKSAQDILNARRGSPNSPNRSELHYEPLQHHPSHSTSSVIAEQAGGSRPSSGVYPYAPDLESDTHPQYASRQPRSSAYGMPTRTDSRSASGNLAAAPSRETSRKYPSHTGPNPMSTAPGNALPLRRSSKGMGGGYASVPGIAHAPSSSSSYTAVDTAPLPTNSEDWKDRGAATGVRREIDADGRTVLKSIKKGVRDFSFGRVLGEGSYSTVYLATDRQTLREYAVKVLEKKHIIKEKKIKYVNIEKNTLNRLTEHPGIVRLYYTFQDETSLYYVLDLCSGGELLGVLKKTGTFDVECTRFYGAQILDAVEYMHSRGIIHRDLKPENVLLDEQMHIKITDFGTAKLLPDPKNPQATDASSDVNENGNRAASFVGTAEYVSPELLTDKTAGKPSDIWAFGCIIYQLLVGRPPFKGGSEYLTFQKIVNLEYDFPAGFPPAARDLVERCLVLDPGRRVTTEHIKNHEFFDGQPFGKGLWKTKAPRLRPYVPPAQAPNVIQLNGGMSSAAQPVQNPRAPPSQANGQQRPARIITELPPPTQLDIEWSPVLTRNNERILKLADLMVISSPMPTGPNGKGDDGHKKLSRFFGGSTTKKRQRLVMVTSSGRIVLAPSGGEEKRTKQDISLLAPDCVWRSHVDAKGHSIWSVDTGGMHYTFEEPKSSGAISSEASSASAEEWLACLERAKDFAMSQNVSGFYGSDNVFDSAMSSPASTLGGRMNYPEGFSISDRSGRNQLTKSQMSLDQEPGTKRNRFSKRQSKNGLGPAAQF